MAKKLSLIFVLVTLTLQTVFADPNVRYSKTERTEVVKNLRQIGEEVLAISIKNGTDVRSIDQDSGVGYCMGASTTMLELIKGNYDYDVEIGYNGLSHYYLRLFDFYGIGKDLYIDPSYKQFIPDEVKARNPNLPTVFIGSKRDYRNVLVRYAGFGNPEALDTYGHPIGKPMADSILNGFLNDFRTQSELGFATWGFEIP